jgi:choice-of-anchor B domain-containing protein
MLLSGRCFRLLISPHLLFLGVFLLLFSENGRGQSLTLRHQATWQRDSLPIARGWVAYNEVWGWADSASGREYAIIGSLDSIYFVDVTDPQNPRLAGVEAGRAGDAIHRDFKTLGHYAYAVADEGASSLQIFDLRYLPDSVHKVYDSDSLIVQAHNIFIENERLYAAANTTPEGFYPMSVYSLAEPEAPRLLTHLRPARVGFDYVHDVFVHGDTAYCSAANAGLQVVDLRDPKQYRVIREVSVYPDQGYNHSGWLHRPSRQFVMADETHGLRLKVVDVRPSLREWQVSALFGSRSQLGSIPHNPFVRDSLVFVSYYHEGVVVFKLDTNGGSLPEVARYDTYPANDSFGFPPMFPGFRGCWGVYPFFPSGLIAASDMENGLVLLRLDTVASVSGARAPEAAKDAFRVGPNPFAGALRLWPGGTLFDATAELFTLSGKRVARRHWDRLPPGQRWTPTGLPAGASSLLLVVTTDRARHTQLLHRRP